MGRFVEQILVRMKHEVKVITAGRGKVVFFFKENIVQTL